ncbi:hypothetical protein [Microaceticoccus formicicus]|uniref:hypothetical protein n=1 Tax=Microaceticoccus formicicus TaxID=3118105 RepID=UPI003CD02D92|nr:hypothetical protein VZL98_03195 [Peptoniphilaceae bacterium AMB_02]
MRFKFNFFRRKKKITGIRGKIVEAFRKFDREFLIDRGSRSLNDYSFFKVSENRGFGRRRSR